MVKSYIKLYLQGTPTNERMVQLRREKRDVDLLVACDDECLPKGQIKDYDVLLQYDDDTESSQGSFLLDFEREPCAFVCKIVGMNKTTEGSNDILDGEFTITSVEDASDERNFETTSSFSHYPPLRKMVGLRKNVSFSSFITENVTTSLGLPNETFLCPCKYNGTNTTNEITTSTPRPIDVNFTESTTLSNQNSSSLIPIIDIHENSTVKFDLKSMVINETTTQQQQLFSVVPVIPKFIRFTVVEAEMAESGVNKTQNSEKTQDNHYNDIKNNVSLAFQSFLESLAPLEGLGLGNIGLGNITHLVNQNLTLTPWSAKLSQIAEEVTETQPLPLQEPTRTDPIVETVNTDRTTKKSLIEEAFQLISPISDSSLNLLQDKTFLTALNALINGSVIANINATPTTTPSLVMNSPTFDATSENIVHSLITTELIQPNRSILDQNNSSEPEDFYKLIEVLAAESPKELSNATSSPSNGTISSNSSEISTSFTNITRAIGNVSKPTDIDLHSSNQSIHNDSVVLEAFNNYMGNITGITIEDYPLVRRNTTHLTNQTTFKDDVGEEKGNHTIGKLPDGSANSSTLSRISDNMKKNVTI